MSQKTAAFWATTILCLIISAAGFAVLYRPYDIAEATGGALAPFLISAAVSLIAGFIGGAIKKGAFPMTFFWCYVISLPVFTLAMIAGGARYY
jgi:hypothetical protein